VYATPDGLVVEFRGRTSYAEEGAWVLDVVEERMPDHYWVILGAWMAETGKALTRLECAHGVRDINWAAVRAGRTTHC
jgi:hypothetical protein